MTSRPGSRSWLLAGLALAIAGPAVWPERACASPTFTTLYEFPGGASGTSPEAAVIAGPGGTLFGATDRGGSADGGVVYQLLPPTTASAPWTQSVLYDFATFELGGYPLGLVRSADGTLFGVALDGGGSLTGSGVVFSLVPPAAQGTAWQFAKLHSFGGPDGSLPSGALLIDAAGGLTGTTLRGGNGAAGGATSGYGVAFRLAPPQAGSGHWTETAIYRFPGGTGGEVPQSPLVPRAHAQRYGVTTQGGTGNCVTATCGTVFQLSATPGAKSATVIYDFRNQADGMTPSSNLATDPAGALYGTTELGGLPGADGTYSTGTVYRLDPPAAAGAPWTKTTLYQFRGGDDGAEPLSGVLRDPSGALFGTTYLGGPAAAIGTVFKLTPGLPGQPWTKTILHAFHGGGGDGLLPTSTPIEDAAGKIYGTTLQGGQTNLGTVYRLAP